MDRDAAAALIARLASIPHLEDLSQETIDELLAALQRLLTPEMLHTLVEKGIPQRGIPFLLEQDKDEWRGGWIVPIGNEDVVTYHNDDAAKDARVGSSIEAERFRDDLDRRLLWFLFKGLHWDARSIVFHALAGGFVILPKPFTPVYHIENGVMVGRLEGPVFASGVLGLLDIIQARPFPFGRCARCENVFVQPHRGRSRRYCSERCKVTSIPSAAKRTEYARTYRHRKREKEIEVAKQVFRAWPRDQHYAQLQKQFPQKSRREMMYLIKHAQPNARARSERGRKEK